MANRFFSRESYSLEKGPVRLWAKVSIGASGAPTLSSGNCKGIASIARNSAGDYTVTLSDKYNKFLGLQVTFQSATGLPAAPVVGIKAFGTGINTIEFVCTTAGSGSATDPGSGETMWIQITLSNSGAL